MNGNMGAIHIGSIVALSLLVPILIADLTIAQAQNATLILNPNNTRTIVNMKDNLIFLINGTTNETIKVSNYTGNIGNTTTNENLTGTTNENLTGTTNENLTGKTTTNVNLTAKFETLQGK
jgi:hypothetical protein